MIAKWEYKIVNIPGYGVPTPAELSQVAKALELLNSSGNESWELVGAFRLPEGFAVLKRSRSK